MKGFNEVVPLQWLQYFDEREFEVSTQDNFRIMCIIIFIIRPIKLLCTTIDPIMYYHRPNPTHQTVFMVSGLLNRLSFLSSV